MGWKFFNSSGQLQTEAPIADNAITNAKLADDSIGVAELISTAGSASSSTFLRGDMQWQAAGGDFSNGGDAGALILGTNDANSLTFETTNTARIVVAAGGITTFTAGGDESIRLAHASGVTWSLQSRSDSEFRLTDNNAGTTRLRVQAGTSGDTLVKDGGGWGNVTRGIAKVWIRFSQTNSAHAMQENYGVASITDGGNAGYTDFTWSRAFASEHYAILISQEAMGIGYMESASEAAGGVTIRFSDIDGSYTDALHGSVACFGDLS